MQITKLLFLTFVEAELELNVYNIRATETIKKLRLELSLETDH